MYSPKEETVKSEKQEELSHSRNHSDNTPNSSRMMLTRLTPVSNSIELTQRAETSASTMTTHTPVMTTHTPVMTTHTPVMTTHTPVMTTHTPVMTTHTPEKITFTPSMSN